MNKTQNLNRHVKLFCLRHIKNLMRRRILFSISILKSWSINTKEYVLKVCDLMSEIREDWVSKYFLDPRLELLIDLSLDKEISAPTGGWRMITDEDDIPESISWSWCWESGLFREKVDINEHIIMLERVKRFSKTLCTYWVGVRSSSLYWDFKILLRIRVEFSSLGNWKEIEQNSI